jgi:glycosyltransferase involved in cell wall biosynthesis
MGQDAKKGNWYANILPLKKMKIISLSENHQQIFLKNYHTETDCITFGISREEEIKTPKKNIDIIGIGSLIPIKNYSLFIDVIFEIKKKQPIKAIIIGEGVEHELLNEKIKALKLENEIELKGRQDHSQVMSYLAQSKVLLHTSYFEGAGFIFSEAFLQKTMVVSRPVGCIYLGENSHIGHNLEELIKGCELMLKKTFNTQCSNPFLIENTIKGYLQEYNS